MSIRKRLILALFFALTGFKSALAANVIPNDLGQIIKASGFDQTNIGLYVQAVNTAKPVVQLNDSKKFNPASVIKLVTTSVALDLLGPGYQWSTDVYYTGELQGDRLNGDLYFVGNGDPYLTPERFWRLLNRVRIFGIREIQGDVYFDSSFFQPEPIDYAAFDDQPYRTYNVGPNALLVGFQATEFHFDVDASKQRVKIIAFPASPNLKVINQMQLSNGTCRAWQKRLLLEPKIIHQVLQVKFSGQYARSCGKRTLYRRVTDAHDHFQHFFLPIWQQLDGSLQGRVRQAKLPEQATKVVSVDSISLAEAVRLINKYSNNVMTRQMLLSLGANMRGVPGTAEKGIEVVLHWLQQHKLDTTTLHLHNGSGLSRDTRVSAELLAQLLLFMYQQAYMPEFLASMPMAGYDGTMKSRFNGEALFGQAHIKTGLLDFVQSMAGYVMTPSGQRYVVVMLHNDKRAHTKAATALQDDILRWVFKQH